MSNELQEKPSDGKLCPKCREPIAHGAKTCKHCGADLRNWFARHKVITAILAIVAFGWIISKATPTTPAAQHAANTPGVAQPDVAREAEITVAALQLGKDYEGNELAADQKYKGKTLRVTGKVDSVHSGALGQSFLILLGSNLLSGVNCYFGDEQVQKAARLEEGQTITVRGVGGGAFLGAPLIRECVIL